MKNVLLSCKKCVIYILSEKMRLTVQGKGYLHVISKVSINNFLSY